MRIPLHHGRGQYERIVAYAICDDWRYAELMQWKWRHWRNHRCEYAVRVEYYLVDGRRKANLILMHVVVCGYSRPDHVNGNGLDNRESNLRPATRSQNAMNQPKRLGTSRFKGVSWHRKSGKWLCQIVKDRKIYVLGYFTDEIEAACAYDRKAVELFGEFARLNFPA